MNDFLLKDTQPTEQVGHVDQIEDFLLMVIQKYPEVERFRDFIVKTIIQTGIENITIEPLHIGVGVSLPNRIVISNTTLNNNLSDFLFSLFHEIAHQFQFKKYGYEKMIELYDEKVTLEHAVEQMYEIEIVADEYATRKLREMVRKNNLTYGMKIPTGYYKTLSKKTLEDVIIIGRRMFKELRYEDTKQLSDEIYGILRVSKDL